MAENEELNVKISDKGSEIEQNVVDEKMEGKESSENEKTGDEAPEKISQKKESTFNRFVNWFMGSPKEKPKDEEKEKENEEENEKEKLETGDKDVNEEKEDFKENEIKKEIGNTEEGSKVGTPQEVNSTSNDRSLLIIEEEGKRTHTVAPLAEAEDADIEDVPGSRPSIDRPVIEPKRSEAVEAEKETTEKEALPKEDYIDAKSENRKSATVFLRLSQPSFERRSEKTTDQREAYKKPSENDDSIQEYNTLVDTQQAVPRSNKQESKMEDVIEERRHDTRKESMQETWKKVEELEPNKTYRVTYTVTTTTIEKAGEKDAKKEADDEDDEKLFGNHVLLPNNEKSSRPKYDGPPPEDLEPEVSYEEAKRDEAGSTDIDKMFEMMAKDGPPPEEGVTVESTKREEDSQEISETPEDIFRKLHTWDKEPTDWWTSTKKKRDYEEWMKPMKDGTIRRVIIPKVEIPYDACVSFVTDWKHRQEWDKTFSEIKILKDSKDSKLIYCPVKKRDLAFETLDRKETDPPCYFLTWKRQMVDKEGQEIDRSIQNKKEIELITHTCGIILRPSESGDQATYITILCQLEGPVDRVLKNTYLAGHPKSWLRSLNKYYKKHQKGAQKKVVYL